MEHVFCRISDDNTVIWRYMDFWKFLSLLQKQALFLVSVKKLEDEFEGTDPPRNVENRDKFFRDNSSGLDENGIQKITTASKNMRLANSGVSREFTVVNCWHINQYESEKMWSKYVQSPPGVAIQSTVGRLRQSFVINGATPVYRTGKIVPIGIFDVTYIGFPKETIPEDNFFSPLQPFLHKRKCFDQECELRVLAQFTIDATQKGLVGYIPDDEIPEPIKQLIKHKGVFFPVDLNLLIDQIIVSPNAPGGFLETVESVVRKYKLNKDVKISQLGSQVTRKRRLLGKLFCAMSNHVVEHNLGEAFIDVSFVLSSAADPEGGKKPCVLDIAFISETRLIRLFTNNPDWEDNPITLIPDLIVEVISPIDRFSDITRKVFLYLEDGVKLIWVIDPPKKTIVIHKNGSDQAMTMRSSGVLTAGKIIPGFEIDLTVLFSG